MASKRKSCLSSMSNIKSEDYTSGSMSWKGPTRDPRIVRVSRSSVSKDRHSKVKTVKGLRDRRVRLSVPTAIQVYDLQEKLGVNQPSKVVDWLMKVNQHEIDKLPPLSWNLPEPKEMVSGGGSVWSNAFGLEGNPSRIVDTHDYRRDFVPTPVVSGVGTKQPMFQPYVHNFNFAPPSSQNYLFQTIMQNLTFSEELARVSSLPFMPPK